MADKDKSVWIDIDDIKIDEMQSRLGHWSDDEKDQALVDSMKGIGQVQEVIVRKLLPEEKNFKYGLVAGSRRFHAIIKAGKPKIKAVVREMTDIDAIKISISENIGRKDLTQYEEAVAIKKLADLIHSSNKKLSEWAVQKEIAQALYGSEERGNNVHAVISRIEKIPKMALVLLKKPEERTQQEKEVLKKYNIPLHFGGTTKRVTDALASLSINLNGGTDEEKTDEILTAFKELHLYMDIGQEEIRNRIITLRNSLEKGNPFDVALKKAKEEKQLFEIRQAFSFRIGTFALPSKQYWDWHGKAITKARMEPDDLVQKVYVDWLERQAKKEGW